MRVNRILIKVLLLLFLFQRTFAQEKEEKKEPPDFSLKRASENYEYLKDKENNPYERDFFDPVKFFPLNQKKDIYLSLGGQLRPRFEHYSNRLWEREEDQNFYSQRISLHSDLVLGKHIRIFGELYHGYSSHEKEFAEYDEVDLLQAFIDFKFPLQNQATLTLRFGRQEMSYGAARLIGIREGPNIRRSFDATRFIYKKRKTDIQVFYGREVSPAFKAFDNKFTLLDSNEPNPKLWGMYSQFKIKGLEGTNEVYYFGFQEDNARFSDATGKETRHSIGLRRFGKLGKRFQYNTEIIYQFGKIGNTK